jgi:hypothetical protein
MKKNISHGSTAGGPGSASGPAKSEWLPPALLDNVLESRPLKPLLTPGEQKELEQLEMVVKKGWSTFLDVGSALLTISEKRLYRDKYDTFEEFFKEELGLSRTYCYNLMGSAKVNDQISSIEDIRLKPLTESQFRELISVPEEKRAEAWRGALKLAGDKPVTAKIVHQAAAKFKPKKISSPVVAAKKAAAVSMNLQPAFEIIAQLEKLAVTSKNKWLLAKVTALRKFLLSLGGK